MEYLAWCNDAILAHSFCGQKPERKKTLINFCINENVQHLLFLDWVKSFQQGVPSGMHSAWPLSAM